MDLYLRATEFFDYDTPAVQAWLARQLEGLPEDPVTRIRALYLAVRDGIRYNPYVFHTDPATFKASHALAQGETYCIPKAVLLGAAARAIGIPSRLGLADVRNHLSSPKLIEWPTALFQLADGRGAASGLQVPAEHSALRSAAS